jgi:hypothetical protein
MSPLPSIGHIPLAAAILIPDRSGNNNHPTGDNTHRFSPPAHDYTSDYSSMQHSPPASTSSRTSESSQTHDVPPPDPRQVHDARLLAFDYIKFQLESVDYDWEECIELPEPNRARLAMREMGALFEKRYGDKLADMIHTLKLQNTTVYPTFVALTQELFSDNKNWGRIVALFSFGGALAKYCVQKDMPQLINNIALWVANVVSHQLRDWIDENGSWDGFVTFYESQPNSEMWADWRQVAKVGAAGVVIGLTAGATIKRFMSQ